MPQWVAVLLAAACNVPLPTNPYDTGDTDMGLNGVYVYCMNDNEALCDPILSPADYRDCLLAANANFFNKPSAEVEDCSYADSSGGYDTDGYGCPDPFAPNKLEVCIGPGNPEEFPALFQSMTLAEFDAYLIANMAAHVEELCSNDCMKQNTYPVGMYEPWDPNCEDANWTGFEYLLDWEPADGFKCNQAASNIEPGYNGGDINWGTPGSPLYLPLTCGLFGTCTQYFAANIAPYINPLDASVPLDLHEREADVESQATSATTLALNMPGSGTGVDDTAPLFGLAEWSRTSPTASTGYNCTNTTCPFYLGNLAAWNYTSTWDVRLYASPTVYYPKIISNVEISLLRSTMGIERKSNGRVAFPIGSLELLVAFDIASCPTCATFGNGHYEFIIDNPTVAFGNIVSGGFNLDYSFPVNLGGTATLHIVTTSIEFPPAASMVSTTSVTCNKPGGYLLDLSWNTSTDPDSDVDIVHWLVDGQWLASRAILPVSSRSVRVEAIDARGAVRRTAARTLNVLLGPACD